MIYDRNSIGDYSVRHYQTLFTSNNVQIVDDLEGLIQCEVTEAENNAMCQIPSPEEIFNTLKSNVGNSLLVQ